MVWMSGPPTIPKVSTIFNFLYFPPVFTAETISTGLQDKGVDHCPLMMNLELYKTTITKIIIMLAIIITLLFLKIILLLFTVLIDKRHRHPSIKTHQRQWPQRLDPCKLLLLHSNDIAILHFLRLFIAHQCYCTTIQWYVCVCVCTRVCLVHCVTLYCIALNGRTLPLSYQVSSTHWPLKISNTLQAWDAILFKICLIHAFRWNGQHLQ